MRLQVVQIDAEKCIGCTKCIKACPTDAIIGAAKQLHGVLTDHCIGCMLCLPPCPIDCIEVKDIDERSEESVEINKKRIKAKKERLATTEVVEERVTVDFAGMMQRIKFNSPSPVTLRVTPSPQRGEGNSLLPSGEKVSVEAKRRRTDEGGHE